MSAISLIFTVLFYMSFIVFFVGIVRKSIQYYKIPVPLKIPISPTPLTKSGVILKMFREVILFESLFRANKWIWIFGWMFHIGLVLVLIRHLRYFWIGDIPAILLLTQPFKYAAFAMIIGLLGLLVRRFVVERVRYISAPSDYLLLLLLLTIAISGSIMTFINNHTDITMVKNFGSGMLSFNWSNLPTDINLLLHLFMVFILLVIFPISKLLHAPGVFFSPTINQIDDARSKRHISNWALEQEKNQEVRLGQALGKDE